MKALFGFHCRAMHIPVSLSSLLFRLFSSPLLLCFCFCFSSSLLLVSFLFFLFILSFLSSSFFSFFHSLSSSSLFLSSFSPLAVLAVLPVLFSLCSLCSLSLGLQAPVYQKSLVYSMVSAYDKQPTSIRSLFAFYLPQVLWLHPYLLDPMVCVYAYIMNISIWMSEYMYVCICILLCLCVGVCCAVCATFALSIRSYLLQFFALFVLLFSSSMCCCCLFSLLLAVNVYRCIWYIGVYSICIRVYV